MDLGAHRATRPALPDLAHQRAGQPNTYFPLWERIFTGASVAALGSPRLVLKALTGIAIAAIIIVITFYAS
jgi:hypothetical protein